MALTIAEQIFAEHRPDRHGPYYVCRCGEAALWINYAAHVVEMVLRRHIEDECGNAPLPNHENDDHKAGFIAGMAHAQEVICAALTGFLTGFIGAVGESAGGDEP
ncbi:hypothetical protein [Rhodococcus spongiicola]|uniref:Uncharacterized protein n=1 Tax=Rhodococcus spongiicola TaxID=2487352 RepID=A0A438B6H9_9NOCA|nr:hypothetical protein [Rhodococcus spongiicola]RVW06529.1 hypothetical protein EF834_03735 [Rhodococcus spongiicola]